MRHQRDAFHHTRSKTRHDWGGPSFLLTAAGLLLLVGGVAGMDNRPAVAEEPDAVAETPAEPSQTIRLSGPGWQTLDEDDFVRVNGDDDTMKWDGNQVLCSGRPVGVTRTQEEYKNFELSIHWRHLKDAGNSGVFAWTPPEVLENLRPGRLPKGGMEIQMLDHGYTDAYTKRSKRKADWFSTNGDVFAVGKSRFKPFPPLSPNGSRSFPSAEHSNGFGQWNHYYVRGINGEIRLWVNGVEVSGGSDCVPAEGYLCLEHEGSPIEFRDIRVRRLP